jgi:transcriptional regulator with XRE-family HTH domain
VTGRDLLRGRKKAGLSQAELGDIVGVSQGTISNWEKDKSAPNQQQLVVLNRAFVAPESVAKDSPEASDSRYGDWVADARRRKGFNRRELAALTGISAVQIYNIETGKTVNPRLQTRASLEKRLGGEPKEISEAVDEASEIEGVGRFTDFDPHDEEEFPSEPGIYVFYDIADRPIYVGQSGDIRRRIRTDHVEKFWFKAPIVQTASYVRVEDKELRGQMERTLIKFLKSNAVLNKNYVDR